MADLTGVWQSTDKREWRYVYVVRVTSGRAHGWPCNRQGMRLGNAEASWQLNAKGDGLKRYRRPTT